MSPQLTEKVILMVSTLLSGLIGAIIGAIITWIVTGKTIKANEKPVFSLEIDEIETTLTSMSEFVVSLKNIGGAAKNVKWEFKYEIRRKEFSPYNGEFNTIGRGQNLTLFFQKTACTEEDDPNPQNRDEDLPYKIYDGKLQLNYDGLYEKNIHQIIPFDIYNQLPPEIAKKRSQWIKEWRANKSIFEKVEKGRDLPL